MHTSDIGLIKLFHIQDMAKLEHVLNALVSIGWNYFYVNVVLIKIYNEKTYLTIVRSNEEEMVIDVSKNSTGEIIRKFFDAMSVIRDEVEGQLVETAEKEKS